MTLRPWQRLARNTTIEAVILLMLYALLYWRASVTDLVARLFAVHGALPTADLALAVGFVAVRFTTLVILPGFLTYRLVRIAIAVILERSSGDVLVGTPPQKAELANDLDDERVCERTTSDTNGW